MPFVYQGSGKKLNKNTGLNLGQRDPRCRRLACDIQVRLRLQSVIYRRKRNTRNPTTTVVFESKQLSTEKMCGFCETMGRLCGGSKFKIKIIILLILIHLSSSDTILSSQHDFDNTVINSNSAWLLEVVDERCSENTNRLQIQNDVSEMLRGVLVFATVNASLWRESNRFLKIKKKSCPSYIYFPRHTRSVRSGTLYTGSTPLPSSSSSSCDRKYGRTVFCTSTSECKWLGC